jgi:hypothetical protein
VPCRPNLASPMKNTRIFLPCRRPSLFAHKQKGGGLSELLLRPGVVVPVAWTRGEAGVAHALQHAVGPFEQALHAELAVDDALHVASAQRADAVGVSRPGIQALTQPRQVRAVELGPAAAARGRAYPVDPAVAAGVGPALHEPAAAAEGVLDVSSLAGRERVRDGRAGGPSAPRPFPGVGLPAAARGPRARVR